MVGLMNLDALSNPNDSMVLCQGAAAMEGVGRKVSEDVPAQLFSDRSGTITHVPFPYVATVSCGKTSHVLCK